jgi:signal transduction histidine kinase
MRGPHVPREVRASRGSVILPAMQLSFAQQARAERVIALARAMLALSWIVAAALVTSTPGQLASASGLRAACFGYLFFAVVVLFVSWRWVRLWRWTFAVHVVDLTFFAGVAVATGGAYSPLVISLAFPITAAAVLFPWLAALGTGAVSLLVYLGALALGIGAPAPVDPAFILMRIAAFAAVVAIIVYGSWHRQKLEHELLALADWPYDATPRVPTRELLQHAQRVFSAPRLLLAWEEPDEPWMHLAWLFNDDFRWIRESPAKYDPIVSETLSGLHFLGRDLNGHARVVAKVDVALVPVKVQAVNRELMKNFRITDVLSLSLDGTTFRGRLFVLDRFDLTSDDLIVGEILARFIVARMDHYYLLQRAQQLAVGEERIRLSRDLHDGVLQSLTGASLQLEAVRSLIMSNPGEARDRLAEIQAVIAADQRELRTFIRQLRPTGNASAVDARLTTRLRTLGDRFRSQWNVEVNLETSPFPVPISTALGHEIYSLVNEGVANAAKHANADRVAVKIDTKGDLIHITVRDNGRGFPFVGRFDLATLQELKRGPVTLKERVASLGGDLVVESSPEGSVIEMSVPMSWQGGV